MLYVANIFCSDKLHIPKTNSGFLSKFSRIQCQAAILAIGALPSTATDVLDAHADLLPFRYTVQKICLSAAMRLATLPKTHLLYPEIKRKKYIWHHHTVIYNLLHFFHLDPCTTEKIPSIHRDPKEPQLNNVYVATSKNIACTDHLQSHNVIYIYTDGSGIEGGIRAAAVLQCPNLPDKSLQYHLGHVEHHTIYEGKLVGILLALHLIKIYRIKEKVVIASDNQAATKAVQKSNPRPSKYIIDHILKLYSDLQTAPETHNTNIHQIKFKWIPAHSGIEGNDTTDEKAKDAAKGNSTNKHLLPKCLPKDLPHSLSTI